MKKKKHLIVALAIWIICVIIGVTLIIVTPIIIKANEANDEIIATYQSSLDYMTIDFDDEKLGYDVYIRSEDRSSLRHVFVKLEDVVVIPYTENEAYMEIKRNGKCKLYFLIKWEAEEECIDKINYLKNLID